MADLLRSALFVSCVALLPGGGRAATLMINNGLAPPEAAKVLDDDTHTGDVVYVRNAGCPPDHTDDRRVPRAWRRGPPRPRSLESSDVTMSGGEVERLEASGVGSMLAFTGGSVDELLIVAGLSMVRMTGGELRRHLVAWDTSVVTMTGGFVGGELRAHRDAIIRLTAFDEHCADFAVDGEPVACGPLRAETGLLTGSLVFVPVQTTLR